MAINTTDVSLSLPGKLSTPISRKRFVRVKSPLRYPGGKSRAVSQILALIPPDLDKLCSPFVGGGSVELGCAAKGIKVSSYDVFEPLVNFWQMLLKDPQQLVEMVQKHHPLIREKFYALQKKFFELDNKLEMAAVFFTLNRSSFSGTTLSGGMSPNHPRFTESAIKRLEDFHIDNFSVAKADFKESLKQHATDFLYLDPPYANGQKLYGNRGECHMDFDHEALADLLTQRDGWILSYNDCEKIRKMYNGYKFLKPEWTYGMSNNKKSSEVLILSKNLN